jgi:RTX calcium-binding nonapeptide repeat (4 copies)/FG-GAP repeat
MSTFASKGFLINGIAPGDFSGYSVSGAGDINGDGISDIIIGAIAADPNGLSSGESYVIFGSSQGFQPIINLSSLDGRNGFKINGIAAGDQLGYSVSNAGDVNGDGIQDLIVGANRANPNGNDSGQSYVIFGSRNSFAASFSPSSLNGTNGFKINGIAVGDRSGTSVSRAGDINGDGVGDLVIGARSADPNGNDSGQSYVVFGKRGGNSDMELSTLNGSNGFIINGVAPGDNSGVSVNRAGDINGDGISDLIIGASRANPNGNSSGQSYVLFGSRQGFGNVIELSTLNGSNGFTIDGISADDRFGYASTSAGDINGDGIDDIIIGSYFADPNGVSNAGQSYVIFGNSNGFGKKFDLKSLNGSNGFKVNGIASGDVSGSALSSIGDVNGDGIGDVLIGATYASPNGRSRAGQNYVVFGSRKGFNETLELSSLNGTNGFRIDGISPEDISGVSVSGAGDVNGDGISDLIIGGAFSSPNGNAQAGQSAVILGRVGLGAGGVFELSQLLPQSTNVGTPGNDNLLGTSGSDQFLGSLGSDTINGGEGNDSVSYAALGGSIILKATGVVTKSVGGTDNLISFETIVAGLGGGDRIDSSFPASTASIVANLTTGSLIVNGATPSPLTFTVSNFENVTGTANNDAITGNLADNVLEGGAGNDTLFGSGGNDDIDGGVGNDSVSYAAIGGPITLKATGVVDKSTGGTDKLVAIETITASTEAKDKIDASTSSGAASIVANLATKSLIVNGASPAALNFTVENFEDIIGTLNDDIIIGDAGENFLDGGAGNDNLSGEAGNDILTGGAGNDNLTGGAGNDNLTGGAGLDTIDGGVGNDTINGGAGADQLRGGIGNNVFGFQFGQSLSNGADRILDFAVGTDKIELFSAAGIAASAPLGFTRAANNRSATTLSALAAAVYSDSNGEKSGKQALGAGNAALVVSTNAGIAGTYLFIDNGTDGFQSNNDLVINITGTVGTLPALGRIAVNSFFI